MKDIKVLCLLFFFAGCASLEERDTEDFVLKEEKFLKSYSTLLIDDFDAGVMPNLLGGDFGAWDAEPEDETQFCRIEFSSDTKVGEKGYSIKIIYDIDSSTPASNGFWMKLNDADFSGYRKLCFWLKGDKEKGFTKLFKIELKNEKGEIGRIILRETTNSWKEVKIPFKSIRGISDFSKMKEFVIVFENKICDVKKGIIYLDNVYVEK